MRSRGWTPRKRTWSSPSRRARSSRDLRSAPSPTNANATSPRDFIRARHVEQATEVVRHAVRAEVRDHEPRVTPHLAPVLGRRSARNEALEIDPVRDEGDLRGRDPARHELLAERLRDDHDAIRVVVHRAGDSTQNAHDGARCRHRSHGHDGLRPEVAHLEDPRDAPQLADRQRPDRREELRARADDDVGTLDRRHAGERRARANDANASDRRTFPRFGAV